MGWVPTGPDIPFCLAWVLSLVVRVSAPRVSLGRMRVHGGFVLEFPSNTPCKCGVRGSDFISRQ